MSLLLPYWRPLLGTAGCWALFDIVEYGLKQNDAAIFDSGSETGLTRGYYGSSDHPMLIWIPYSSWFRKPKCDRSDDST